VDLYSASSRTRFKGATAFRTSALISVELVVQPDTSPTLTDSDGYGVVYHTVCLFSPPAFIGYSNPPAHRGIARAEYSCRVAGPEPKCLMMLQKCSKMQRMFAYNNGLPWRGRRFGTVTYIFRKLSSS